MLRPRILTTDVPPGGVCLSPQVLLLQHYMVNIAAEFGWFGLGLWIQYLPLAVYASLTIILFSFAHGYGFSFSYQDSWKSVILPIYATFSLNLIYVNEQDKCDMFRVNFKQWILYKLEYNLDNSNSI